MTKKHNSKLKLFGLTFEKNQGNLYLRFAKPIVLGGP
jgi:hypothetical protein